MADGQSTKNVAEAIAKESVKILGVPEREIRFVALQSQFVWVRFGELIWARTTDFKAAVFWASTDKSIVLLNGDSKLDNISALLVANVGSLPGGLSAGELAATIRKLTVEPRGFVASTEFYRKVASSIKDWTGGDARLQELFVQQCGDSVLTREEGKWRLQFRYFNPQGGVEMWTVEGDSTKVNMASANSIVADRTFRYPFRN